MKRLWILFAALTLSQTAFAAQETYNIDPAHSEVGFKIRHMFSDVHGRFTKYEGKILVDPDKMEKGSVEVSIEAASVNTDNDKRDTHLRTPDFFDAAKYPKLVFKSTSAKKTGKDTYQITGNLTIRDKTKPVVLDVEVKGFGADPMGSYRSGFHATTRIDRKDFGINWNKALDQGGMFIGDDVGIDLSIEAVRK
jgi:polyisoprenoid-binding protein YceI